MQAWRSCLGPGGEGAGGLSPPSPDLHVFPGTVRVAASARLWDVTCGVAQRRADVRGREAG